MLKSLAILTIAVAVLATPADAKSKRRVAKPVQCAGLAHGFGGCNPMQFIFSPVVLAADISAGIINGVAAPFR